MSEQLIMAVDVGNTNTVVGIFDNTDDLNIQEHWRTVTIRERTSDELGIFLRGFLHSSSIEARQIKGFIYSSVVPPFNPIVERMAQDYFYCEPIRIVNDMPLPIEIVYPRIYEIGADRIVNAVAAHQMFSGDLIVVDMGTATTFCLIKDGKYFGGSIAPGLKLSMEALTRNTAQLPTIEFKKPECGVIADSTIHAMQSGFFFGWTGLLREIMNEIEKEYPGNYKRIATGGLSALIKKERPELFHVVDPLLTLKGLKIIYQHQWRKK